MQNYKNIVNLWMKTTESLTQNAGPGEDDDDEDIEHESDQ